MRHLSRTTRLAISSALSVLLSACAGPSSQPPLEDSQTAATPVPQVAAPQAEAPALTAPPVEQPRHIALLLPLSGKLAAAGAQLRDGFFQAYYQAQAAGAPAVRVDLIDENAAPDLRSACQQAIAGGAQLVVGPLAKERLRQLQQGGPLNAPVLALNQVDEVQAEHLYQYGLGVEDEARQLAELMRPRVSNVLIMRGRDELANRASRAFAARWTELQGTVFSETQVDDSNAGNAIKEALGIAASERRIQEVQSALQRPVNAEARPRADIEAIVLLARPTQAQQVLPTLSLFGAQRLPIAGISLSNSGGQSRMNSELEGLYLLEIPEVLSNPNQPTADRRLYAMGQDSYTLAMNLAALTRQPDTQLTGRTGTLSLGADRRIHRKLSLARFQNGQLQTVESFAP